MTEPLSGPSSARSPAPTRSRETRLIVPHRPIDEDVIAPFAAWMDTKLRGLEHRFAHLTTPHSMKASLQP
jgi:hypothetical protein